MNFPNFEKYTLYDESIVTIATNTSSPILTFKNQMEYKGYKIEREQIGKYGTSFQYRCGKYIAPRKKDIKQYIDNLLKKKMMLDIELEFLQKI